MAELPQSSNHRALTEIARDILRAGLGGKISTGLAYQQRLNVGAGTVQKALRILTATNAVTLRAHGHQGTRVIKRNLGQLWQVAALGPVRVLLTPPGADEHYGLAVGLEKAFGDMGVPISVGYLRSARQRAEEVFAGSAEIAVMSKGAAAELADEKDSRDRVLVELGEDTYYGPDSMLVVSTDRRKRGYDGKPRIAVDRDSYDHRHLTYSEFPDDGSVRYVECEFPRVPAEILRGNADQGIWHHMELLISPQLAGLRTRPLRTSAGKTARAEVSSAVLLADTERTEVATLLSELDVTAVCKTQESALSHGPDGDRLRAIRWSR